MDGVNEVNWKREEEPRMNADGHGWEEKEIDYGKNGTDWKNGTGAALLLAVIDAKAGLQSWTECRNLALKLKSQAG